MARGEQQHRYRKPVEYEPEPRENWAWIVILCAIIFAVVYWGMR